MTDQEIREALEDIDCDENVTVTSWEAEFIDSVVYKYKGPLSGPQRKSAEQIIEKYGG